MRKIICLIACVITIITTGTGQSNYPDKQFGTSAYDYFVTNSFRAGLTLESLGNIKLPTTTSSIVGSLFSGNTRVLHFYGTNNIFLGQTNGNFTTSGVGSNIAIGSGSGITLSTGADNNFIGVNAGRNINTGEQNIAIGSAAMYSPGITHTAKWNTAIGFTALYGISSGQSNVAIGLQAGLGVTTGSNNILIGESAYQNITTGSSNVIIGQNIDAPAVGTSNSINISNTIYGNNLTGSVGIGGNTLTSLFNIGATDQFQVNTSGKIAKYNGITTANNGVLSSVGTPVIITGQTAAISTTGIYTADQDGFYQVCWQATITTAGTISSVLGPLQITYTNAADNVLKTWPSVNTNNINQLSTNSISSGTINGTTSIYAKSGTSINYIMGYTANAANSMAYSLNITVVKL